MYNLQDQQRHTDYFAYLLNQVKKVYLILSHLRIYVYSNMSITCSSDIYMYIPFRPQTKHLASLGSFALTLHKEAYKEQKQKRAGTNWG